MHTRKDNFFLIEQNDWNLDYLENDDGETCSHLAILQGTGRRTINSVMDFNYYGVRGKKNQSFDKSKLGVGGETALLVKCVPYKPKG